MPQTNGTPRAPRRPPVERTCLQCGRSFVCKASDRNRCCSRLCSDALKRSRTPLERLQAKTSITGECWLWVGLRDADGYGRLVIDKADFRAHRLAWQIATEHTPTIDEDVCHTCDTPNCWRNDDIGIYILDGIEYERRGHLWLGDKISNMRDRDLKGHTTSGDAHWMRTNPEKIRRGDNHPSRLYPEKRPKGDQHWTRLHPERLARGDASGARMHPETRRGERNGRARLTVSIVKEIRAIYAEGKIMQKDLAAQYGLPPSHISQIIRRIIWSDVD